jgi:hypothetical protein
MYSSTKLKRFGDPCCLHHQGGNGGSKNLLKINKPLQDYTALQPRRQPSSVYWNVGESYYPCVIRPLIRTTDALKKLPLNKANMCLRVDRIWREMCCEDGSWTEVGHGFVLRATLLSAAHVPVCNQTRPWTDSYVLETGICGARFLYSFVTRQFIRDIGEVSGSHSGEYKGSFWCAGPCSRVEIDRCCRHVYVFHQSPW